MSSSSPHPRRSSRRPKLSGNGLSNLHQATEKVIASINEEAAKVGIDEVDNKDFMIGTVDSPIGTTDSHPPDNPNTKDSAVTTSHSPVATKTPNAKGNAEAQTAAKAHSPPPADPNTTDSAVTTSHSPVGNAKAQKATKAQKAKGTK